MSHVLLLWNDRTSIEVDDFRLNQVPIKLSNCDSAVVSKRDVTSVSVIGYLIPTFPPSTQLQNQKIMSRYSEFLVFYLIPPDGPQIDSMSHHFDQ